MFPRAVPEIPIGPLRQAPGRLGKAMEAPVGNIKDILPLFSFLLCLRPFDLTNTLALLVQISIAELTSHTPVQDTPYNLDISSNKYTNSLRRHG